MMHAEKALLETDSQGRLKGLPMLPPNRRIEAVFLIMDDPEPAPSLKRCPASTIAGKGKTLGDLIAPIVPEEDWDCLK